MYREKYRGGKKVVGFERTENIDEHLLHMLHSTQGTQHKIT